MERVMRITHRPAREEENSVTFSELDFPHLVRLERDSVGWGRTLLAHGVEDWLHENAPGWTAIFDKGDWGEGFAIVTVTMREKSQAAAFRKRWEK